MSDLDYPVEVALLRNKVQQTTAENAVLLEEFKLCAGLLKEVCKIKGVVLYASMPRIDKALSNISPQVEALMEFIERAKDEYKMHGVGYDTVGSYEKVCGCEFCKAYRKYKNL